MTCDLCGTDVPVENGYLQSEGIRSFFCKPCGLPELSDIRGMFDYVARECDGTAITCPACNGAKHIPARVQTRTLGGGRQCVSKLLPCFECTGAGVVPDQRKVHLEAGQRIMDLRVEAGLSLRSYSTKLGITPEQLSNIEMWGRLP